MKPEKEIKSIEAEGKNIQEAIEYALDKLGVSREDVEIKILTEGQRGLFGMKGARQAKVRVTVKEKKTDN